MANAKFKIQMQTKALVSDGAVCTSGIFEFRSVCILNFEF